MRRGIMGRQAGHRGRGKRAVLRGDARGAVPVELALGTAVILLPVTLVVLSLPLWVERQMVAQRAANESARALVLAGSWSEGVAAADAVVGEIAANYDLPAGTLQAEYGPGGPLTRGMTVQAQVTVQMPALNIPFVGDFASWSWTAEHAEHVDNYRSF